MALSFEQSAQSTLFRKRLREERIALRQAMSEPVRRLADAAIEAALKALLTPMMPGVLAFCWPVRGEFDARPLANFLAGEGWRLAMPVVARVSAPMEFRPWQPQAAMTTDPFGIPIPASLEQLYPDVVLAPLVAFDDAGYRLGYGGGYFDRTLAGCCPRPLGIGVGYELGRVDTIWPEAHDIPLDRIVTEAGIFPRDMP